MGVPSNYERSARGDRLLSRRAAPQGGPTAPEEWRAYSHMHPPKREYQKFDEPVGHLWRDRRDERHAEHERRADAMDYPVANEKPPPDPLPPSPLRLHCAEACARAEVTLAEQHKLVELCSVSHGRAGAKEFAQLVGDVYEAAADRSRAVVRAQATRADQLQAQVRTTQTLQRFDHLQACARALWSAVIDEVSPQELEAAAPSATAAAPSDPFQALEERLKP